MQTMPQRHRRFKSESHRTRDGNGIRYHRYLRLANGEARSIRGSLSDMPRLRPRGRGFTKRHQRPIARSGLNNE